MIHVRVDADDRKAGMTVAEVAAFLTEVERAYDTTGPKIAVRVKARVGMRGQLRALETRETKW